MNITGMKINRKTQRYGSISDATKLEIDRMASAGKSQQEIADWFEMNKTAITNYLKGKS